MKQVDLPRAEPISTQTSGFIERTSPCRSHAESPRPEAKSIDPTIRSMEGGRGILSRKDDKAFFNITLGFITSYAAVGTTIMVFFNSPPGTRTRFPRFASNAKTQATRHRVRPKPVLPPATIRVDCSRAKV